MRYTVNFTHGYSPAREHRCILALMLPLLAVLALQPGDWPNYGGDPGGSRYSPLAQVNRSNVTRLRPAWTYRTGDFTNPKQDRPSAFQATPILVEGTLYVPTPFNRVIAIHPGTGAVKWIFDPKLDRGKAGGDGFVCRGVATWSSPETGRLIFLATLDARLIAIRAADGAAFWQQRLSDGVEVRNRGEYHMTSPPTVVNDRVIVGSAIDDNNRTRMPSGVVRGYDAKTGKLVWTWDPIPQEKNSGAANAWSVLSADPARDLVFIPTGSASPDHYGGERPGDNRWANSVVALRASTGEFVWGFQTVHHDLWDYDVSSQPVLGNVRGKPAVIQPTKMGQIFVLNRDTGAPIFPVTERPVPGSEVPGEQAWPTQPFSSLPPLVPHKPLRAGDAWGLAYFDRRGCAKTLGALRSEGIYTPPGFSGSVMAPSIVGGTNWGSAAYDSANHRLIVNASIAPFALGLAPRDKLADAKREHPGADFAPMHGTPYVMWRRPLISSLGIPCVAPPWGLLTSMDLERGRIEWQVPLGTIRDIAPVPLPMKWGTPSLGGPLLTAGGLVFIGAAMDNYLRAFDARSGAEIWRQRLPAGAQATPMTYEFNGKQYVVIAAGGHGRLGTTIGDYVIAYALP